jgi:pSer/pThr/pTyr-binding forkhead associated (FHA) protein
MNKAWLFIRVTNRRQVVGRSDECDIQIPHPSVSRRHAEIWQYLGVLRVRDLESRNGTLVNGVKVAESQIEIGNVLHFGDVAVGVATEVDAAAQTDKRRLSGTTVDSRLNGAKKFEVSFGGLSDAQLRVLQLLLQGLAEKHVAASLAISQHTVHSHVKEIYRVMGVNSRAELMALYVSQINQNLP